MLPSLLISIPEGVIDLGWGHPSPSLHPTAALREAANHALADDDPTPLQYGATQGYGPLLHSLAAFLSEQDAYRGVQVRPQDLFLTAGASQAIDLAATLFARAGDAVYVEEPTYYLVGKIFKDHGLRIISVPADADGMDTDALESMLHRGAPKPKLLYIIPDYQNPSGASLPEPRRKHLAALAQQYGWELYA